jgi:hypothetical protein
MSVQVIAEDDMRTRLWIKLLQLAESDFDEEIFAWIMITGAVILGGALLILLGQEVVTLLLG